jgi:hypothetical protein
VEGKVVRGEGKNRRRVMFRNVEIHYQLLAWCDGGSFRCGGGWRWRLEETLRGRPKQARGQVNGSRGTCPDNGVLCEDGKFDGESLSSPSDGRPTALLYLKGVGGGRRGLGPPGARSGVKLPLRVAQEQTDIFCSLSSLQCFPWLEDSWFGEMARHDILELALLQEKGAQGEVTDRKTSLQKVETCIELATDMHYFIAL